MGCDSYVTRASGCKAFNDLHESCTPVGFIAIQSTPFALHNPHAQTEIDGAIDIVHAAAPPAWERVSKVGIDAARLINQSECSIDRIGVHRIEVDGSVYASCFLEDFL